MMLAPEFPKYPFAGVAKLEGAIQYRPLVRRLVSLSPVRPLPSRLARKLVRTARVLFGALTVNGFPFENEVIASSVHPPTNPFNTGEAPPRNRPFLPTGNCQTVAV